MLQYGETVNIIKSNQLTQLKLDGLVGRQALVTRIVRTKSNRVKGAWLVPQSGEMKDEEVYVPIQSIEGVDQLNMMRVIGILKQTVL